MLLMIFKRLSINASHTVLVSVDVTVSFDQSSYSINENSRLSQHVLVLSNPSSTNITVQVIDNSSTAIGKHQYCHLSTVASSL